MLKISSGIHHFSLRKEEGEWFINDKHTTADVQPLSGKAYSIILQGKSYKAIVESVDKASKTLCIAIDGHRYELSISEPIDQLIQSLGLDMAATQKATSIKAPMPGLVLKVLTTEGTLVHKGDSLLILEAMKMENILKAPATATVKKICVTEKTAVEKGAVLIEME